MSHSYGHVSVNSKSSGDNLNHGGFIQTSQRFFTENQTHVSYNSPGGFYQGPQGGFLNENQNHEGFTQTSQGLSNGNQIQGEFSGQQNVGQPRGFDSQGENIPLTKSDSKNVSTSNDPWDKLWDGMKKIN